MDKDLEKVLNNMWKKTPKTTKEYLQVQSTLLLVQAIRDLTKALAEVE